ncbi:MAG: hypothetical protein CL878_09920 [Dehalococcoidia bacterium]|nr:hypothetical protein [Dehalococcoidia bacterium]
MPQTAVSLPTPTRGHLQPPIATALHQADVVGGIALVLATAETTDQALPAVVRLCAELLGASAAAMFTYAEADDRLTCREAWGLPGGTVGRQFAPVHDAPSAECRALHRNALEQLELGRSVLASDLEGLPASRGREWVIAAPLATADERLGVLAGYGCPTASPADFTLLRAVARRVARAWVSLQRHDAERRRAQESLVLAEIARVAGSTLDLEQVLARITQRASELAGADRCSIWLWDERGGLLLPSALHGMDSAFAEQWKQRPLRLEDEPLSQEAFRTGEPVAVNDAMGDPRTDKVAVEFFNDRSILVVPLVVRGRSVGTMFLNHVGESHPYSPHDIAVASAIGSQAAIAIENARLFQQSQRQSEQLREAFQRVGEALVAGQELDPTLQVIAELAAELVLADECIIHIERLSDASGAKSPLVATARRPRVTGEAGRVDDPGAADAEAELTLPLILEGQSIGFVRVRRDQEAFHTAEKEVLQSFAAQIAVAIDKVVKFTETDRLKTEFVSLVSHELRTPLALIKGYVSTLLNESLVLPEMTRYQFLQGVDSAADRLKRLIDNVLSVTRIESEFFAIHPVELDLRSVVAEAAEATDLFAQGAQVDVQQAPEPLPVRADRDHLRQVLENLIVNALKYGAEGEAVVVSLGRTDGYACVRVQDRGPGIPPEQLERIFEKFYRVANTANERPVGSGLGLYIARRVIDLHGGHLWAENDVDGGATFSLQLPLADDDDEQQPALDE